MSYLRQFPRFADLTDEDVAILERVLVVETGRPGHVFVREGNRAEGMGGSLYIIIEGEIAVAAARPQGGFGVERALGPGQMFGQVALLADVPRTATCTAKTPVRVARLERRAFDELNRRNAGVHARFQLVVARQLAADIRALRELFATAIASGDDKALHERYGRGS